MKMEIQTNLYLAHKLLKNMNSQGKQINSHFVLKLYNYLIHLCECVNSF